MPPPDPALPAAPGGTGSARTRAAPPGRERELADFLRFLEAPGPGLLALTGPRGRGKTTLLRRALSRRRALHLDLADLPEGDLLEDLRTLCSEVLGGVPEPRRPGVLPPGAPGEAWPFLLAGLQDRVAEDGEPLVLALDGIESLLAARRRIAGELAELVEEIRMRGIPLKVVLAARSAAPLGRLLNPGGDEGGADLVLHLEPLPFRVAGWGHGGRDPRDAFMRWTVLGDHPAHLPRRPPEGSLAEVAVSRILDPRGDLHDAPLKRLAVTFQRPARYAAVLRAVSEGPLGWSGILERAPDIRTGGQLAPYLRRLEEEGLVRVALPLDAPPGSRRRRYVAADPFLSFWFGRVLPHRSLLGPLGPRNLWRRYVRPGLAAHMQRWLEEGARRWLLDHAEEVLSAPAREVGGLWGGEAEFPVAGRLTNGQVCYGLVRWGAGEGAAPLGETMARCMSRTRYGIGREARAPLFFLDGEGDEDVRRMVAREPLGRVVGPGILMGPGPPGASSA